MVQLKNKCDLPMLRHLVRDSEFDSIEFKVPYFPAYKVHPNLVQIFWGGGGTILAS